MTLTLEQVLAKQRTANLADGAQTLEVRVDRMNRAIRMLLTHEKHIVDAYYDDFGGRSRFSSKTGDILGSIDVLEYTKSNLEAWMMPQQVSLPSSAESIGTRAELHFTPLGVIGKRVGDPT